VIERLPSRSKRGIKEDFVSPDFGAASDILADLFERTREYRPVLAQRFFGNGGTPASWLGVLDRVAALNAAHVLPDHSAPGDGSLVAAERDLISEIRTQALALKRQNVSADDAGKQVSASLKTLHHDWPNTNAAGFVKSVYAEP
jgi:hypothetical protein